MSLCNVERMKKGFRVGGHVLYAEGPALGTRFPHSARVIDDGAKVRGITPKLRLPRCSVETTPRYQKERRSIAVDFIPSVEPVERRKRHGQDRLTYRPDTGEQSGIPF